MFKSVANHIFSKQSDLRKEIGEIMGGRILDLESERLLRPGKEKGEEKAKLNIAKKCWNEAFLLKIFNSLPDFQEKNWKIFKFYVVILRRWYRSSSFFVSKQLGHICYIVDELGFSQIQKEQFSCSRPFVILLETQKRKEKL